MGSFVTAVRSGTGTPVATANKAKNKKENRVPLYRAAGEERMRIQLNEHQLKELKEKEDKILKQKEQVEVNLFIGDN